MSKHCPSHKQRLPDLARCLVAEGPKGVMAVHMNTRCIACTTAYWNILHMRICWLMLAHNFGLLSLLGIGLARHFDFGFREDRLEES